MNIQNILIYLLFITLISCIFYHKKYSKENYRINDNPCTQFTERCYYPYQSNKKIKSYKCCKDNLIKLLKYMTTMMNRYKILYFIDYGTLLGCLRNNKFIPWDTDIDISIIADKNIDHFLSIIKNNNLNYHLVKESDNLYRLNYSIKNSLHIDISIRNKNRDNIYYDKYSINNWGINEKDLFPLKYSLFEDIEVYIPNNSIKYLENGYGKGCINEPKTKYDYIEKY